jgi:rod shape-determining protein MreC
MESFFSRYKNGLVLLGVLLAQLIGLALQVRRPLPNSPDSKPVRLLRYWVITALAPPARVSHGAGKGARGIWSNYIDLRNVREQNLDLQAEIERLRLEEGAIAEDARQGQRLQRLLDFKEHYIYKTVTAQVIGTAGSDRSRLLIVDKGSNDGIALEMPVITPDGIVGKVREVFPDSAQVLEISDQASGAGVMLETTRIRGVLRGNAYGQPQIINILPDDRIKPGERVLTSGGDQIYPRGLPVGVVKRVANDPERNPYIDVIVEPGANLSRLEEVLIITSMGDQLPPGAQSDLAKSEAESQQHSAAEVLSEKLPSIRDPNDLVGSAGTGAAVTPGSAGGPDAGAGVAGAEAATPASVAAAEAAKKAAAAALIARSLKPPPPLHPDRFTTGASTSAPLADGSSDGAPASPDGLVAPKRKPATPGLAGHAGVGGVSAPATAGNGLVRPVGQGHPAPTGTGTSRQGTSRPGLPKAGTLKTGASKGGSSKAKQRPTAVPASAPTQATPPPAPTAATQPPEQSVVKPEPAPAKYVEPYVVKPQSPPPKPQQPRPGGTKLNPITRPTPKPPTTGAGTSVQNPPQGAV